MGALLFAFAAWVLAAFAGGSVACVMARVRPMLFAGIVGVFVLAATAANLVMLPHPTWFAVVAILSIVLATFAAGKVATAWARL